MSQLALSTISDMFTTYINEFNEDYQTDLPTNQRNEHPLSKQIRAQWAIIQDKLSVNTNKLVDINDFTKVVTQQVHQLNHDGYYRAAVTLNTLAGDLQTSLVDQIICLGHVNSRFILVEKAPAQDNEGIYYYYHLKTIPIDTSINELYHNVHYLMTDDDIHTLLTMNDPLDGWLTMGQQIAMVKTSVIKQAELEQLMI